MRQTVSPPSGEGATVIPALVVMLCHAVRILCGTLILILLSGTGHATPTPTPNMRKPTPTARRAACWLPPSGSKDLATFTVTGANGLAQSYDLVGFPAGRINVDIVNDATATGEHALLCHVKSIDPLFIHYLSGTNDFAGYLCITPSASACSRTGKIACNGGVPLGFFALGDSDIGHCGGNAGCKNKCKTFCQNEGLKTYGSHCALAQSKCECRCISRNTSSFDQPGTAQCYLGAHVSIEAALPCGDGDAFFDFGDRCFPMTTDSTTAEIDHADFSQAQIGPIEEDGAPIQCDQISSDMATGLVMDGQVPLIFHPPSSDDVILTLHVPCGASPTPFPTRTPIAQEQNPTSTATKTPTPKGGTSLQ